MDGRGEVRHRVVEIPLLFVSVAPAGEGQGIFRIDRDGFGIVGNGAIVVVFAGVDAATIVQGARVVGIEFDDLRIIGQCAIEVVPGLKQGAAVGERRGVVWIERDGIIGDSTVEIPAVGIALPRLVTKPARSLPANFPDSMALVHAAICSSQGMSGSPVHLASLNMSARAGAVIAARANITDKNVIAPAYPARRRVDIAEFIREARFDCSRLDLYLSSNPGREVQRQRNTRWSGAAYV